MLNVKEPHFIGPIAVAYLNDACSSVKYLYS